MYGPGVEDMALDQVGGGAEDVHRSVVGAFRHRRAGVADDAFRRESGDRLVLRRLGQRRLGGQPHAFGLADQVEVLRVGALDLRGEKRVAVGLHFHAVAAVGERAGDVGNSQHDACVLSGVGQRRRRVGVRGSAKSLCSMRAIWWRRQATKCRG